MTPSHPTQMDQQSERSSGEMQESNSVLSEGRSSSEDLPPAPPVAHTPGPWRLADDAQGPCMVMHPTQRGVAIASLTNSFKPENGFHDVMNWPHERNANARLIAAAPDLLEALQGYMAAVAQLNEAMQDGVNVHGALSTLIGCEDNARAAIALATKETTT